LPLTSPGGSGEAALQAGSIQKLFQYQSARVIALGRAMLSAVFLIAIWLDDSQPSVAANQTYLVLTFYMLFSAAIALVTWRNWWADARLAMPAHLVDMAAFAFICFSVSGYTSPFFLVFVLPLMSAAIRWGWRETGLTALALVLLFRSGGLLVAGAQSFEIQRFARLHLRLQEYDSLIGEGDPRELALKVTMAAANASRATILLHGPKGGRLSGLRIDGTVMSHVDDVQLVRDEGFGAAFLFDIARDRALSKGPNATARFARAATVLDPEDSRRLGLGEGLIALVNCSTAQGWLVLEGIPDISGDYIELGEEFGRAAGALLDRAALLVAIADGAAARTRLGLARDVHDSIVQFIAGASFRVEAIARAARSGVDVDSELKDLKELLVEEQREIRGFVNALRSERELALAEAVEELRALAARLGQHWAVKCQVATRGEETLIPIHLQLDLQHLLREAVANAVRHGGADRIDASLYVEGEALRFDIRDNGTGFGPTNGASPVQPWSLRERVERAKGSLFLVSEPGRTNVSISLPLNGAAAA
jgi:signal transduction histidine kinase